MSKHIDRLYSSCSGFLPDFCRHNKTIIFRRIGIQHISDTTRCFYHFILNWNSIFLTFYFLFILLLQRVRDIVSARALWNIIWSTNTCTPHIRHKYAKHAATNDTTEITIKIYFHKLILNKILLQSVSHVFLTDRSLLQESFCHQTKFLTGFSTTWAENLPHRELCVS